MIVELGHFALVLGVIVACLQTVIPSWGARTGDNTLMAVARPAALAQFALLAVSFFALVYAFVTSDFSVELIAKNSHSAKPLIYKISGTWGNHEGSMLLWIFVLAMFGAAVAVFGTNLRATLHAYVLSVQASIVAAFGLFVLLTSNPFLRLDPAALEGRGLNPILQDPALAFHPPFLYIGYVGFSMAFSFAVAALIDGRVDAVWARWVRPWTLAAWMFLTIGIAMGSWWAYYELGWGGWWFWDPVENASFMPWLAATALLHTALVMEKREALKVWTILLAILTFSLSLMGAFLVRSGVLTSVHSFAVDPERGVVILAIMVFFIGGSLALFAWRAPTLRQGGLFSPISREGSLVLNNILLTCAAGMVLVGTLYPLVLESLTGLKISVGAPYFNITFSMFMVPLLLAMPFGPLLAWKRADLLGVLERLIFAAIVTIIAIAAAYAYYVRGPVLAPFGLALGVFVMAGAVAELAYRVKFGKAPLREVARRLWNQPRSAFGGAIAHFGVGMMVVGIVATSAYRMESILVLKPGETTTIAGFTLKFVGEAPRHASNYSEQIGVMDVSIADAHITRLHPAKRKYDAPPQITTEAGIYTSFAGDLYTVLGDRKKNGAFTFRIYFNPLVRFIWLGALIMALGGAISMADRRFRVGAPKQSRNRSIPVPAE